MGDTDRFPRFGTELLLPRPATPESPAPRSQQSGAVPQGEGAMLEPQGGIFRQALGGELLVSAKLRLTELGAPPPVRPHVEECGRTFGKGFLQGHRCFML